MDGMNFNFPGQSEMPMTDGSEFQPRPHPNDIVFLDSAGYSQPALRTAQPSITQQPFPINMAQSTAFGSNAIGSAVTQLQNANFGEGGVPPLNLPQSVLENSLPDADPEPSSRIIESCGEEGIQIGHQSYIAVQSIGQKRSVQETQGETPHTVYLLPTHGGVHVPHTPVTAVRPGVMNTPVTETASASDVVMHTPVANNVNPSNIDTPVVRTRGAFRGSNRMTVGATATQANGVPPPTFTLEPSQPYATPVQTTSREPHYGSNTPCRPSYVGAVQNFLGESSDSKLSNIGEIEMLENFVGRVTEDEMKLFEQDFDSRAIRYAEKKKLELRDEIKNNEIRGSGDAAKMASRREAKVSRERSTKLLEGYALSGKDNLYRLALYRKAFQKSGAIVGQPSAKKARHQ